MSSCSANPKSYFGCWRKTWSATVGLPSSLDWTTSNTVGNSVCFWVYPRANQWPMSAFSHFHAIRQLLHACLVQLNHRSSARDLFSRPVISFWLRTSSRQCFMLLCNRAPSLTLWGCVCIGWDHRPCGVTDLLWEFAWSGDCGYSSVFLFLRIFRI